MQNESPQEDSLPSLDAPARVGEYEILEKLAQGGMARVYLARRTGAGGFQRLYALKLLHTHLADDPTFTSRFLDEARLAARLHHNNVVGIVDVGYLNGTHYAAMDYIEGSSLHGLLSAARRRPVHLLVPILIDLLNGLQAAHVQEGDDGEPLGLVHRDVSPANVLIGTDGVARVTDFGISKARDHLTKTRTGMFLGKFAYGAPEQFLEKAEVDARADLFAAGVTMWTALTGQPLFRGASAVETLTNVASMEVPRPSGCGVRPPECLDAVCLKALQRDPEKRFQTAQEMADALHEVARQNDLLGTRVKIAEWVWGVCGEDLKARRERVRARRAEPPPAISPAESGVRQKDDVPALPNWSSIPPAEGSQPNQALPDETRADRLPRPPSLPRESVITAPPLEVPPLDTARPQSDSRELPQLPKRRRSAIGTAARWFMRTMAAAVLLSIAVALLIIFRPWITEQLDNTPVADLLGAEPLQFEVDLMRSLGLPFPQPDVPADVEAVGKPAALVQPLAPSAPMALGPTVEQLDPEDVADHGEETVAVGTAPKVEQLGGYSVTELPVPEASDSDVPREEGQGPEAVADIGAGDAPSASPMPDALPRSPMPDALPKAAEPDALPEDAPPPTQPRAAAPTIEAGKDAAVPVTPTRRRVLKRRARPKPRVDTARQAAVRAVKRRAARQRRARQIARQRRLRKAGSQPPANPF